MARVEDMTGQVFGRLTVLERAGSDPKNGGAMWLCRCKCGNTAKVRGSELRSSRRSCGCALAEHRMRGPGKVRMQNHEKLREEMRRDLESAGVPAMALKFATEAWA